MHSRTQTSSLPVAIHNPVFVDEEAEEIEPPAPGLRGRSKSRTSTTRRSKVWASAMRSHRVSAEVRRVSQRSTSTDGGDASRVHARKTDGGNQRTEDEIDISASQEARLSLAAARLSTAAATTLIDEETCLICMMPFSNRRNQKCTIPCLNKCNDNVVVHPKCIFDWKAWKANSSNGMGNCPLCRGALGEVDYTPPHMLSGRTLQYFVARRAFVCRPVPQEVGHVRCYVKMFHGGLFSHPRYELWMQQPTLLPYPLGTVPDDKYCPEKNDVFLLSGRKRTTRFGASRLDMGLDPSWKNSDKDSLDYCGTVVSSFSGLEHQIVVPPSAVGKGSADGKSTTTTGDMRVIACVLYSQNRVGLGVGPRKMKVGLANVGTDEEGAAAIQEAIERSITGNSGAPAADEQTKAEVLGVKNLDPDVDTTVLEDQGDGANFIHYTKPFEATRKAETMPAVVSKGKAFASSNTSITYGENVKPKWVESIQAYSLDFQGRVTEPSNKNFQLSTELDDDQIVLQFGKLKHTPGKKFSLYSMDVQYPLSPLQAFGICLACCDRKLACA